MFNPKIGRALAALAALGAVATFPAAPAFADPTPSECVQYSIYICGQAPWQSLGYISYGQCRLQEYDDCMNGVPPRELISFKPKPNATVPTTTDRAKRMS